MAHPDQLSLMDTEPEPIAAQGLPLQPLCRSLKRLLMPHRNQLALRACELDAVLPEGHWARVVWAYVAQTNLDPIYAEIKAMADGSGRAAIAPEVLSALCLYATLEGLSSARALACATQTDDAYRWLCVGL